MREPVVGQTLPVYERVGSFHAWNRFAAVNDEFIDIHMDDEAAAAAGYPGAIGMGNLQTAYLHCLLREWMGVDGGVVTRLRCQFRSFSLRGRPVVAQGVITSVEPNVDGGNEVDLEVWTESDTVRLATGTASVRLHHPRTTWSQAPTEHEESAPCRKRSR